MKKLENNNVDVFELLNRTILTEENATKSKKIRYMRNIIIGKYVYAMNREEICAECDFISLSTYTKLLNKALSILYGKI